MSADSIQRPVVLYDSDCGFCKRHVAKWKALSGDAVEYAPFQESLARFPHISKDELARAVHLVEPSGAVYRGADAVFRLNRPVARWCSQHLPGFAAGSEFFYAFIARHRTLADLVDRALFGSNPQPTSHRLTRSVFLRALGAIYLIAFISLWVQISGLIGSNGILPIARYLDAVNHALPGADKYWRLPTLCWLSSSDGFLNFLCCGGVIMSVLLIAGVLPIVMLIGLWAFYLSLTNAGQDFLSFQWDSLLLEAGCASIFFAPAQLLMRWRTSREPSHVALWLVRWLAFRIMFLSGMTKLVAGDTSWTDGTALTFHYWTQPLPPWSAWYMNRLPLAFSKFSVWSMFAAELVIPFFIFTPRIPRRVAFFGIVLFQVMILLTGNYGFFNLLTIVLCIPLLEDGIFPKRLKRDPGSYRRQPIWSAPVFAIPAIPIVLVTLVAFAYECQWELHFPKWMLAIHNDAYPFRSANGYGLFRVMTKQRHEIIIEGSNDGADWKTYEFKWKPGDLDRKPAFLVGHMPRLDWQMWFAALSDQPPPWFISFLRSLLEGSPRVSELLQTDPFPDHPPKFVRALVYDYQFSDDPHAKAWWKRRFLGVYVPMASLRK